MTATTHNNLNTSDIDTSHDVITDPKIAEISERFGVSPATADVISVIDDGGIHAGGGAPDEWRDPAFAGLTAGTSDAWNTARDKGGYSEMGSLLEQIASVGREPADGVRAFNSEDPRMAQLTRAGLTVEEARNFVVYALAAGETVNADRGTEILHPMNPHENNPGILLAKGEYTPRGGGRPKILEVTTTVNSEGQAIGFSAATRPWNPDMDGPAR